MEIRKLKLSDQAAYRRFEADMLKDKQDNPFIELAYIEDLQKAILDNQHSEIKQEGQTWSTYSTYYAFVDGDIAGMIRCFWEADNPTVIDLGQLGYMISPKFRRQGIAQDLLDFSLKLFKEKGYNRISIVADEDNLPSRRLIEKMGGQLAEIAQISYFGKDMIAAKYWLSIRKENT